MASNLRYIINSATGTVISANGESNVANIAISQSSTSKKPATTKKSGKSSSAAGKAVGCKSHGKPAKTKGDELLQLICEWYRNFSEGPVSYTKLYKVSKLLSENLGLKRLPPRWIDVLREQHQMIIVAMPACMSKPKSTSEVVPEKPCLKPNAPKLALDGHGAVSTNQPVDLPEHETVKPAVRDTVVVLSDTKKIKKEAKSVSQTVTVSPRKSVIIKEVQAKKGASRSEAAVDQRKEKLMLVEAAKVSRDEKPEDHPKKFRLISSAKISDKDTPDTVLYAMPVIKFELIKK